MRVVIVGAGFTGQQLAKVLVAEKNDVVLIDNNEDVISHLGNRIDCIVVHSDGNSLDTLEKVNIDKADALVCLTSSDEVNMITCSLVDAVYPDVLKIARVRNYDYYVNTAEAKKTHVNTFAGKHRPLYGIDHMIHPDVEAAEAIVRAVENGALSSVLTFDDSDRQISSITISESSVLNGKTLAELRTITDVHLLIAYVEKDGKTSLPDGKTVITAGCTLGILFSKNDAAKVLELCGSKQVELKKIAIIGAGRIGTIVAERMVEPPATTIIQKIKEYRNSQKIVIIDSDPQLAKAASQRFPQASVFKGDATDESLLRDEGIVNFDLAICATHNHELNMVLAAYLESLGVRQSISLVNSSAFATIAQKLGIDVTVALRDVVVDSIMSHMRGNAVKEIHTVTNGDLEIVECIIPSDSKVIGKKLRELSNSGKYLALLDKHPGNEEYEIVTGDTVVSVGDHLVLISSAEDTKKTLEMFGNSSD